MTAPLYTTALLRLAVAGAAYPPLADAARHVERRTPVCGSRIALDLDLDAAGKVARLGMAVQACAVGQAAAAVMAASAVGRDADELTAVSDAVTRWLSDAAAPLPDWPDIAALLPVRHRTGRHAAMLLPFRAIADAAAMEARA